jgi:4a-hydroxytetrahydrobiopterin dehydratase
MSEPISIQDFHDGAQGWRVFHDGGATAYSTGSFAAGARLVQALGGIQAGADQHLDVDLRRDRVTVRLITRTEDFFGLTRADVEAANRISQVAHDLGFEADPSDVQTVQVSIDALAIAEVMPFWRAVLGYEFRDSDMEDVWDPRGRGAPFWFQEMDEPRLERNRIHVDVSVATNEIARSRVEAALAAGGHVVTDRFAPMWWTLADPEGNEVDVTSLEARA